MKLARPMTWYGLTDTQDNKTPGSQDPILYILYILCIDVNYPWNSRVGGNRADRQRDERPPRRASLHSKRRASRSTTSRPMFRQAVAAGEGALHTFRTRAVSRMSKS